MLLFGLPLCWQVSASEQIQYFSVVVQPIGLVELRWGLSFFFFPKGGGFPDPQSVARGVKRCTGRD